MKLLSQPYLLTLNPSFEMNIVWIQPQKTTAFVEYGNTEALGTYVEAQCYEIKGLRGPMADGTYGKDPNNHPEVSVWQYIAKIENLSPGEKIYYKCYYGNECTKIYFFHTAPEEGSDFCFTVISDLQCLAGCDESVYKIGQFHPDFILFSGDATYNSWRLDQWFDISDQLKEESAGKKAFFHCMQQENGARLMQYAPIFVCPGNHELNDIFCGYKVSAKEAREKFDWSIFMQIFRPLYSDPETGINGVRWYSVDYGDMHIVSLNINRVGFKDGFYLFDSITGQPANPLVAR